MKGFNFNAVFAELFPERWDAANNAPSSDFEYYIAERAFQKGYALAYDEMGAAAQAQERAAKKGAKSAKGAAEAE